MERPERVYLLVASEVELAQTQPVERASIPSLDRSVGAGRSHRPFEYFAVERLRGPGSAGLGLRPLRAQVSRPSTSIGRPSTLRRPGPGHRRRGLDRRHQRVARRTPCSSGADDGSLAVVDLDSTNGTYVNEIDEPIPPHEPRILADGDAIYLGAWTCLEVRRALRLISPRPPARVHARRSLRDRVGSPGSRRRDRRAPADVGSRRHRSD